LADTFRKFNKYHDAINCIDQAIQLNPVNSDLYLNKAILYYFIDKKVDSIENISHSIKLSSNCSFAFIIKATLLCELNNEKQAIECLFEAFKHSPHLFLYMKKLIVYANFDELKNVFFCFIDMNLKKFNLNKSERRFWKNKMLIFNKLFQKVYFYDDKTSNKYMIKIIGKNLIDLNAFCLKALLLKMKGKGRFLDRFIVLNVVNV